MPKDSGKNDREPIKETVKRTLWGRSAGRCAMCNCILHRSPQTQKTLIIGNNSHFESNSSKGPRGNQSSSRTQEEANDISNLMLLCHDCHKTVDEDKEGKKFSISYLKKLKQQHEDRVEIITGISPAKKSHTVTYRSRIGKDYSSIQYAEAVEAMFPNRYPINPREIDLSMGSSLKEGSQGFWCSESNNLTEAFKEKIIPLIRHDGNPAHFSLFALAPMPLLIKLGSLFTDKSNVDVYQLMREPRGWRWQEFPEGFEFEIRKPEHVSGNPALIISLSAKIERSRVTKVLGDGVSIWELTISSGMIGNDNIRHQVQLSMFRSTLRKIINEINEAHGESSKDLSIFPAMSCSCSVEMGRVRMPKADIPWKIYDENRERGGFVYSLTIGGNDD